MTGLNPFKNLDVNAAQTIMGKVFPRLPIRVGRICIFNPPWIVGHVLLPVLLTFMSKKLRGRVVILNGHKLPTLDPYVPPASRPAELGGSFPLDEAKWSEAMVAGVP